MTRDDVLAEQRRYYAARAPEYDDWWFRRGRYTVPPDEHERWEADIAEVEAALARFDPRGDVLELAAGTGLWTQKLAATAERVVAVDANREVLELNRARVQGGNVEYVVADLFAWKPSEQFDVCFFGFWLSHVPDARLDEFWSTVAAALRAGGGAFLVDSAVGDTAHTCLRGEGEEEIRNLADGREFRLIKVRRTPSELDERLRPLGWSCSFHTTANGHFVYGSCRR
jgi:SAM-dependent methyltransferase